MKFDFKKRQCEFGVFNNRRENEGQEKLKRKAIDLPFRFQIKPKELDMVAPTNGVPLSQFLFGEDLRKPELQTHLLSPMKVQRKPEHIDLQIFDDVDKRKVMRFKDTKIKDPTVEIEQDGTIYLTGKFQIHPDGLLDRISDTVEAQTVQFECKATQPELFDAPGDGEEGEDGDGGAQGDLMGDPSKEGEEEDDDD